MPRKRIDQIDEQPGREQPGTDQQPVEDDSTTVSLTIAAPDDVSEAEQPSRLKRAFQNVFTTTDEEERNEKKPRRKKSTFFVKHTYLIVGGLMFVIHYLVPDEYKEVFYVNERQYTLLPTETHITDILTPLARIADRHTHIADINPDVLDVLASAQACVACGMEIRASLILKAHIEKKQREEEKLAQQEVWRNRLNGLNA